MKYVKIHFDETQPDRFIRVRVTRGRKKVTMTRTEADVLTARRGSTIACMNANCATRLAASGVFPHPVYLAVFNKRSAYFVHKLDKGGQPAGAVWYTHNNGYDIDIHDKIGPTEVSRLGLAEKNIVLYPPKKQKQYVKPVGGHPSTSKQGKTPRRVSLPYGARRRAKNAGFFVA